MKPAVAIESAPGEPTQSTAEKEEKSVDSDKAASTSTGTNETSVSEPLSKRKEVTVVDKMLLGHQCVAVLIEAVGVWLMITVVENL